MEKTLICLLHAQTDSHGNLYKTAQGKLEELAVVLRPFVSASTRWLHDGVRPGINTIVALAPHFGISVTREELEDDIAAVESGEEVKAQQVVWLPSLESDNPQAPHRSELELVRNELFAHLSNHGSMLACMGEQFYRCFFQFLAGTQYAGQLNGGDAIVLRLAESGTSLVLVNTQRLTV